MHRIAFVTAEPYWTRRTGYFALTQQLIEILRESWDCHAIVLSGGQAEAASSQDPRPLLLRAGRQPSKRLRQVASLFTSVTAYESEIGYSNVQQALKAALDQVQPDLIIWNHLRAAFVAPTARLSGIPSIYWSHNCESAAAASIAAYPLDPLRRWYYRTESRKLARLEEKVLKSVSACVSLTDEDASRHHSLGPSCPGFTIPPAFDGARATVSRAATSKSICLVGSFHWLPKRLNATWLAEKVFPLIRAKDAEATLDIVGSGASKMAAALGGKPGVRLHSDVNSVAPFYESSAVAVIPEMQKAGFKLKALEAASYGMPIVSTPEGIEGTGLAGGHSCLVASSPQEFAASIVRILQDKDFARRIGTQAKETVRERFSIDVVRQKIGAMIDKVANAAQCVRA